MAKKASKKTAIAKRPALDIGTIDVATIAKQLKRLTKVDDIKKVRDQSQAIGMYLTRRGASIETVNNALEVVLRGDRRLGELCSILPRGRRKKGDIASPLPTLKEIGVAKKQASRWKRLAALEEDIFEEYVRTVRAKGEKLTYAGAVGAASDRPGYDGDEHYIPRSHIERVRRVLGDIDLDPASCDAAQGIIGARHFFTKETNGLAQDWIGRIWLNPPFSEGAEWAEKLIDELEVGHVSAAIAIQNAATDTKWFHALARESNLVCFPAGRINFIRPDGESEANRNAQVFFYFGEDEARFVEVFGESGLIGKLEGQEVAESEDDADEDDEGDETAEAAE